MGFSSMYAGFVQHIDVAGLGRQGIISVLSFVDFECNLVPLPVGHEAKIAYSFRLCRALPKPTEQGKGRLMFEVRVELSLMPGTGDPKRYRDVAEGASPLCAGRSRLVLVLTRPSAPPEQRLMTELPAELSTLREHLLEDYEAVSSLSEDPPADYEAAGPTVVLDSTPLVEWKEMIGTVLERERRQHRLEAVRRWLDGLATRLIEWWTRGEALYQRAKDSAGRLVNTPVLLVVGEQDRYFDINLACDFVSTHYAGPRDIWRVRKGRHLTNHVLDPEAYAARVLDFLRSSFERVEEGGRDSSSARSTAA